MSSTPSTIASTNTPSILQRLRNYAGAAAFLLIHRFPLLLRFQRSENSWNVFRVLLGCFGAALVVLPLSFWVGWVTGILAPLCGLLLFVASILLPAPETESATDRKARELGANTMVSGGKYQSGNAPPVEARLFISTTHIWALDKDFDSLLIIPTPEISSLSVVSLQDCWSLRIRWSDLHGEFRYSGVFAERFARLAEESIRAALPGAHPEPLKRRAAAI
jgi:hypothetical protein